MSSPIELISIGMVAVIVVVAAVDLWTQHVATAPFIASLLFAGAYAYLGIAFTLNMAFYSGPNPHGAHQAVVSAAVLDFILGAILVLILRSWRFSILARYCTFCAFVFPGSLLLLSQ